MICTSFRPNFFFQLKMKKKIKINSSQFQYIFDAYEFQHFEYASSAHKYGGILVTASVPGEECGVMLVLKFTSLNSPACHSLCETVEALRE